LVIGSDCNVGEHVAVSELHEEVTLCCVLAEPEALNFVQSVSIIANQLFGVVGVAREES
jgi:hypothetical protein